jgi:citrate synthase
VLDEDGPLYRGHRVEALAEEATFEQVAELLWTGDLPASPPRWPGPTAADVAAATAARDAIGRPGLSALTATATVLGEHHPDDPPDLAARRLLGVAPLAIGASDPGDGPTAERLVRALTGHDDPATVTAVDRALVLLADHELTTSTLAVRVAVSVRPPLGHALVAGLATMAGDLHGGAAAHVGELLEEVRADGAAAAIARRRARRERIPGFGHSIYRRRDPRLAPLLAAVELLPDPDVWAPAVDDLLAEAGARLSHPPNVDLGLGVLHATARLAPDTPLFAVARLAGFGAHAAEELEARPVRYRGLARPPD